MENQLKYNIMTVMNSDYFNFGKMFVNSFYDVIDLNHINKLYIYDTGLNEKDLNFLKSFKQLEVMLTNLQTKHTALHDADWCKNVYSKTAFLLEVIKKDKLPTIMIDSDCLFIDNFFHLLDSSRDFLACQRKDASAFSEYIASFFVIHSINQAEDFISRWREEMYMGTENHKESPALTRLIKENLFDVGILDEDSISYTGTQITDEVKIVHMKSSNTLRTVEQRIHQPHLARYCEKYLPNESSNKTSLLNKLTPAQKALLLQKLKNK